MSSGDGFSDLGLELGQGTFSELAVEAQAVEAFARFDHKVPEELKGRFMNAATVAVNRAAAQTNDPRDVKVEALISRFEAILQDMLDGKDVYG